MLEPIYQKHLNNLHHTQLYRRLPVTNHNFSNYLNFASNDYLALSQHPQVLAAAQNALHHGMGATGSRLLSGNKTIFTDLECQIATDKNTNAALLFTSGFQTNITVLATLLNHKILGHQPIVFFDRSNHASLYQAAFLSQAELVRYRHNDLNDLANLLNQYKSDMRAKFVVTETLFGMDGDYLPITELLTLARQYNLFVYLDEAHATGMCGPDGYGLSTECDFTGLEYLIMGTFSKALGSSGGYVACSEIVKNYLINYCPGFIYSTALSPILAAANKTAWELISTHTNQRQQIQQLAAKLKTELHKLGFDTAKSESHIVPIIVGTPQEAMHMAQALLKQQIITSLVRPPTVPANTSRIRIAINATHTAAHIEQLINALKGL